MSMDMGSMAGMDVSQIFNMFSRMGGMGGRSGNVQFKVHCTTGGGGIGMDISQLFGVYVDMPVRGDRPTRPKRRRNRQQVTLQDFGQTGTILNFFSGFC